MMSNLLVGLADLVDALTRIRRECEAAGNLDRIYDIAGKALLLTPAELVIERMCRCKQPLGAKSPQGGGGPVFCLKCKGYVYWPRTVVDPREREEQRRDL